MRSLPGGSNHYIKLERSTVSNIIQFPRNRNVVIQAVFDKDTAEFSIDLHGEKVDLVALVRIILRAIDEQKS